MTFKICNLVFEGEGVRGLAYAGALFYLDQTGLLSSVKRVAGASSGAITALMLSLGYTPDEMVKIIMETDFSAFRDRSRLKEQNIVRLLTKNGWYLGKKYHDWIRYLIREKTGDPEISFSSLKLSRKFRDLYVIGTNLSTHFAETYSFEHTPEMSVAEAVRISAGVPLLFTSRSKENGDTLVDGAVCDAYPIRIFDRKRYCREGFTLTKYYEDYNGGLRQRGEKADLEFVLNNQTLGFRVDTRNEIAVFRDGLTPESHKISNLLDFSWHLVLSLLNAQNQRHLESDDWQRTVYISTCGVNALKFNLSDDQKSALIKAGLDYTEQYFQWRNSIGK